MRYHPTVGNKHHKVMVCDAAMIAEVTAAAALAARTGDRSRLVEFVRTHAPDELFDQGEFVDVSHCLSISRVDGYDDFVGLEELSTETFIEGNELVPLPQYDYENPDEELLARVLEEHGAYSAREAHEVVAKRWRDVGGSLCDWAPAVWAVGDDLVATEKRVREYDEAERIRGDLPVLRNALAQYRELLQRAASANHAVVEWIVKL